MRSVPIALLAFVLSVAAALPHQVLADLGRTEEEIEAYEKEIAERVRTRRFPGGPDEEDLRVQRPLPTVARKLSPAAEAERAEAEVSED